MKIDIVKLYSYELKLLRPIVVKGHQVLSRTGYVLELGAGPARGYGEISPLEGFSSESMTSVRDQLGQLRHVLMADHMPDHLERLEGGFHDWLGNFSLLPSVAFGIEMAILNLIAGGRDVTLTELLADTRHTHIPINGLLQGEPALLIEQARQLVAEGFTAIKLKVGRSLEDDIRLVKGISQAIDGHALLHLDANQAWSLDEAVYFGNEVGLAAVDYIEEPLASHPDIPEFFRRTTIPVALDETLRVVSFNDVKKMEGVDVIVLKPSIIGGIEKTWDWVRDAKAQGINTLISSIFKSSLGLLCLANLAGCSFRNNAAGLDTGKWFESDLLREPLEIQRGKMEIGGRRMTAADINFDLLTEVPLS